MNALHSKPEVPQGAVNDVINEVVSEGDPTAAQATPENGRQALEQLKTTHAVKGKTGPGGVNRKDMGEHKVTYTFPINYSHCAYSEKTVLGNPTSPAME